MPNDIRLGGGGGSYTANIAEEDRKENECFKQFVAVRVALSGSLTPEEGGSSSPLNRDATLAAGTLTACTRQRVEGQLHPASECVEGRSAVRRTASRADGDWIVELSNVRGRRFAWGKVFCEVFQDSAHFYSPAPDRGPGPTRIRYSLCVGVMQQRWHHADLSVRWSEEPPML
jgi:hypothetical protein